MIKDLERGEDESLASHEEQTVVRPRRSARGLALLLFAVLFPLYAVTSLGSPSLDAGSAHFAAWHLVDQGHPWIEDADYLTDHPLRHVWVAPNGEHEVISRAPGVVVVPLPAYLVAQLDEFSNVPGGLTAALLTALSMVLLHLALSHRLAPRTSFLAALALGLGTPVWSVAADAVWPHTLTVFAVCGMAWGAATGRWWVVGLFGGIGVWGRSHFALVAAVVGLGVALLRRQPSIALKVGIPAVGLLGLMMIWTRWMYGAWRLTGSYQFQSVGALSERYPNLFLNELGLFFALERGIFAWTPVILLLVPTLVRGWSEVDDWAKVLAIGGLLYTLAQGYAQVFHGGDSYWGYRLGLEFVACTVPALAMAFGRAGPIARVFTAPLIVLQVLVIGIGAAVGSGGSAVADAWWRNSMAVVVATSPLVGVVFVVLAGVGGIAVNRALARQDVTR